MLLANAENPGLIQRSQLTFAGLLRLLLTPTVLIGTLFGVTQVMAIPFGGAYVILSVIVFALTSPGLSQLNAPMPTIARNVIFEWMLACLVLFLLGYATGTLSLFPTKLLLLWGGITPFALLFAHAVARSILLGLLTRASVRAVIVGVNDIGLSIAERMRNNPFEGVTLVGFIDNRQDSRVQGSNGDTAGNARLIGMMEELPALVRDLDIHRIYLALPMASQPRILALLDSLRDTTASIFFVPDIFIADLIQARVDNVGGLPVFAVCETPFQGVNGAIKRISDLVLATLILILCAPLMIAIALAIKLSSPGPVLFRQRRYGLDGKEIVVFKFRTMQVMEDGDNIVQAKRNDSRLTPVGGFLRRTSLDELPQFFNVLEGSMSVVGPRPHAVAHNELYRKLIGGYMVRHKVKPGVTGWAQVNGLRGETESIEKMKARIEYDLEYIRHWHLRFDLYIVFKTVLVVLKDQAAY